MPSLSTAPPTVTSVLFDSARVPAPLTFGIGVPPAGLPREERADPDALKAEARRDFRRGWSTALTHGSDEPPAGCYSPRAFRLGHSECTARMNAAFEAGSAANLAGRPCEPPASGGEDADDFAGLWTMGWEDAEEIRVRDWAAIEKAEKLAADWDRFIRRYTHVPSDDALLAV